MSIATWNTQGHNPLTYTLNQGKQNFPAATYHLIPDYICFQEVGNANYGGTLGPAIVCAWNPAPSLGVYHQITNANINGTSYNGYHIPWRASNPGNQRCSLAILWRAALGPHANFPIGALASANPLQRPVVWVTPTAGTPRIGCVHAPGGGNMGYMTNALNGINAGAPVAGWRLAGDINIEPGNLGALPGGVAQQNTGNFTHQGGANIDYLFYRTVAPFVNAQSAGDFVQSDHLQCRFS